MGHTYQYAVNWYVCTSKSRCVCSPSPIRSSWPKDDHSSVTEGEFPANSHNESDSSVSFRVKRLEPQGPLG
nr:hypothetical protein [Kibdelosporangium sp. MJ126-NF4]CTQ94341.1 hypothetical protein [Kibdelosporangium sp. MJ126-NF4]